MTTKACGCSTSTCGCCEGTQILTPVSTVNRPGLDALVYRAGTYGSFFETMKARLGSMSVQLTNPDGTPGDTLQPLLGLTTRDSSDPSIALLDGWATVGDVLTFYQERIANEGYLRTATERRSVLELARLVGYALRPGVAASVFLAYTLDDNQTDPVTIAAGAASQSIPGPGELPQTFETSDDLLAHAEWNNLQVRLTQPVNITFDTALTVDTIYVSGTSTNLKTGDSIMLLFNDTDKFLPNDNGQLPVMRRVSSVESQFDKNLTLIQLVALDPINLQALTALALFMNSVNAVIATSPLQTREQGDILQLAEGWLMQAYLGVPPAAATWTTTLLPFNPATDFPAAWGPFLATMTALGLVPKAPPPPPPTPPPPFTTDPSLFVNPLLLPQKLQAASSLQLTRDLSTTFALGADVHPQLLLTFAPQLKDTFYQAWQNAVVNATPPVLQGIYAFRVEAPLFGGSVPKPMTFVDGVLQPQPNWLEWPLSGDEANNNMFLDQAYDAILPSSYVLIQQASGSSMSRALMPVSAVETVQRTAYGISAKTTELTLADNWRSVGAGEDISTLRPVLVYGQSEQLTLLDAPIPDDVSGTSIPLDQIYSELTSGRWVIFSGERTDIPGVTGVVGTELLMIAGLTQFVDPTLPGDTTHTVLQLATTTAYHYKRDNLTIYGNVVKATHGATKNEVLGSGDGTQALQSFTLKQPPVTFVSASTPAGAASTLQIYVNNVEWEETDSLAGLGSKDREFITQTDDNANTTAIFGNGVEGSRLPTGVQNITSIYRSGIGQPGNVDAGQISLLQTRPLGVKSVTNPLAASGGADKEAIDLARENAPLAVMSLDRLVSVQDYADFTRTFAGIGKAASVRLSDGRRELVYITIAGADDIPIDTTSDLYRNLLIALGEYGDPALPVAVDLRELVALVLSVNVALEAGYLWDPVAEAIRAAVLDAFGFQKRSLGQPALLSELIALIQNIDGVDYLDVLAFGGIPEKQAASDGTRQLLTLTQMAAAVQAITGNQLRKVTPLAPGVQQSVSVNSAGFENGGLRPAQLAIFTDAVPDTLILNQI
jgi:predicted phage baseplate assembly protein